MLVKQKQSFVHRLLQKDHNAHVNMVLVHSDGENTISRLCMLIIQRHKMQYINLVDTDINTFFKNKRNLKLKF